MAGLREASFARCSGHLRLAVDVAKAWIRGTSPRMTT